MKAFNTITIVGRISTEPEMRYIADGSGILNFRVPVDPYTKQGAEPDTMWFQCSLFGKRAETLAPMLHKGSPVYITGPLVLRSYKANDGSQRTSLDIRVQEIQLLDSKAEGEARAAENSTADQPMGDSFSQDEEKLPF